MRIKKIIIFIVLLLFIEDMGFAEQKLFLVGDNNNVPACYENKEGKIVGVDVDIIREMAIRAGIDVTFKLLPWKRVLSMIEQGTAHGGFPLFVTPERQEYSLYTKVPVHRVVMMVYVKQGNEFKFEKLSDLYGKTIGINRGFSISPEFDLAVREEKLSVHEVNETHQLIKMLWTNRLKVVIAKQTNVGLYLKETGKKLTALGSVSEGKGAFLVLSKAAELENKEQLHQTIDRVMLDMEKDGTIEKITKNYIE